MRMHSVQNGPVVQKKTCLLFNAFNLRGESKRQKRGYQGYVEYFGVYGLDTRRVYMIHVTEYPVNQTSMRLEPTGKQGKNQRSEAVRWTKDYEI